MFIDWYERCWYLFAVYIQCKTIFFWNSITNNAWLIMFGQKLYQDVILISFTTTPHWVITATNTGELISSLSSKLQKVFPTKLQSSLSVSYRRISSVVMKKWSLKSEEDCSLWSSSKNVKVFQILMIVLNLSFRSECYLIYMWFSLLL